MGPRYLQAQIHADYATGLSAWSDYRSQIKSMYDLSDLKEDFNDHLIREYNRKINTLNQSTSLYISPFDAGFRFTGNSITSISSDPITTITNIDLSTEDYELTEIPNSWKMDNADIKSVSIGDIVTIIQNSAFGYCFNMTNVTFKEQSSLTNIRSYAFQYCESLVSLTIPNSVTTIGGYAFAGCSSLTSISLSNNITNIPNGLFEGCSSLASVTIPNGVITIGGEAFEGCSSLTSIIIPSGVTLIKSQAFASCINLTSIHILAMNAPTLENVSVFDFVAANEVHVPVGAIGYGSTYGGLTVVYDL